MRLQVEVVRVQVEEVQNFRLGEVAFFLVGDGEVGVAHHLLGQVRSANMA